MTLNISSSNLNLQTARSSVAEGLSTQANNVAQATQNIQGAFVAIQNTLAAASAPAVSEGGTSAATPVANTTNTAAAPADNAAATTPATPALAAAANNGPDRLTLSPETEVAQQVSGQNQESLISSVVSLQTASLAFIANLRALETVNDLERQTVDILR